jgi:hypothetical protein
MKYKNSLIKRERRILDFTKDSVVTKANMQKPGSFTKPGSQNRHKN